MDHEPVARAWARSLRPLGIALLVAAALASAVRLACVSHEEICEDAGGVYVEIADVIHVCSMPDGRECPPTFDTPGGGGECSKTALLGATFRWETW